MLQPYLKIWEWEWIFGRPVKAIFLTGRPQSVYAAGHILAQGFKAKRGGSVGFVADLRFDDFSVGNKTAGNLTDSYVPSSHGVTYMLCLYLCMFDG